MEVAGFFRSWVTMSTLETLRPLPREKYTEGDFVVYPGVPVFKEHQTREMCGDDGEVILESVWIGESDLQAIMERCNERIEDTGDYAALVLRHTDDEGLRDPKVVGFAGPYQMGVVGNKEPLAAILADFHIFASDVDEVKRYPRVSVEFWADRSNPKRGYFDPISLLGAEAPELDLGIRYAKGDAGAQLVRYSKTIDSNPFAVRYEATAAGGSNTFVPSTDEKKQQYQKETAIMALGSDDIRQIVEALKPTIQEVVAQSIANVLADPNDGTDVGVGTEALIDAPVDPAAPMPDVNAPPPPGPPEAAAPPIPGTDDAMPAGEPDGDEEEKPAKYEADKDEGPMVAKYRKQAADYSVKYQKEVAARRKAEEERDSYRSRIESAEKESIKAVRYQKLQELSSQGFVFDLDEEAAETADLSDDQFAKHADRIATRYQRVATGMLATRPPQKYTGDKAPKSQKYAKQAAENVEAARKAGKKLDYRVELDRLCAESAE